MICILADMYPNCEIYILSLDTDVFLLAIHLYQKLSPKLVIRTGNAPDIRDVILILGKYIIP